MALSIVGPSFWCRHWKAKNYISLKLTAHSLRWVLNVKSSYLARRWHGTQRPFLRGRAPQLRAVPRFLRRASRPQLPAPQAAAPRDRMLELAARTQVPISAAASLWQGLLAASSGTHSWPLLKTRFQHCPPPLQGPKPPRWTSKAEYWTPPDHVHCTWGPRTLYLRSCQQKQLFFVSAIDGQKEDIYWLLS